MFLGQNWPTVRTLLAGAVILLLFPHPAASWAPFAARGINHFDTRSCSSGRPLHNFCSKRGKWGCAGNLNPCSRVASRTNFLARMSGRTDEDRSRDYLPSDQPKSLLEGLLTSSDFNAREEDVFISSPLPQSKWMWAFPLSTPLLVIGYNEAVQIWAVKFGLDPMCWDPMNLTLFTLTIPLLGQVPFCLWNATHVTMFAFITAIIPYKKFNLHHAIAFALGVAWFVVEPQIFTAYTSPETVASTHVCLAEATAYANTWRPRPDDLLFNFSGQLIAEALMRLRAAKVNVS